MDKTFSNFVLGDYESKAVELCKIIKQYGIYESFAGFGKYMYEARRQNNNKADKLAKRLMLRLNGQKEETHHVWAVIETIMVWLSGRASKEFKDKVDN